MAIIYSLHSKDMQKERYISQKEVFIAVNNGEVVHRCNTSGRFLIKYQNLYIVTCRFKETIITQYKAGKVEKKVTLADVLQFPTIENELKSEHPQVEEAHCEKEEHEVEYELYMLSGKTKVAA
jgi:hypothetical protein